MSDCSSALALLSATDRSGTASQSQYYCRATEYILLILLLNILNILNIDYCSRALTV